eukprot:TRINITY_DN22089_c0_g1_i1.p1 TRINITY_DN22089_c0_g1~~TRINITY_DN22089_c0_g1_i1.p1  ORF type:complete len:320 (-),score=109.86 TRINITY_DN22089_c0_g1_i1:191-1150(-)
MADDDVPLAALAGKAPKTKSLDDELPLASLLGGGKAQAKPKDPKAGGVKPAAPVMAPKMAPVATKPPAAPPKPAAAAQKPAAAVPGKAKAVPTNGKRKQESSSSSSSSDSSDSDDSEEEKKKSSKQAKRSKLMKMKKKASTASLGEEAEPQESTAHMAVKQRDRTAKQKLAAELLCRWWYALPVWPPEDEAFYQEKLAEKKLRQVTIQEWEWVNEEDSNGRRKVYQLSQFRGVYRDSAGDMHDLRPQESCPCYANFMKKEMHELYGLLVTAYEEQLKQLLANPKTAKDVKAKIEKEIRVCLTRYKDKAAQAKSMSGSKK